MKKIDIDEKYQIIIFEGIDEYNPQNYNVDVEVIFNSSERYVATFFTITNIQRLMKKYKESGECNFGKYFWSSDMIIVEQITETTIRDTIKDLIQTKEFYTAFSGLVLE